MRFPLLRDILNKDVPKREPQRPFGHDHLPHNGLDGDTRIPHVGSTQKSASGLTIFHPDLVSSASHDDAQEFLRPLQQSADALPNHYLKSAVSGVSALWQTAKRVEQSKEEARALSQRSLEVLETLADAVEPDPFRMPPLLLENIRGFEKLLFEIRTSMEPLIERGRISRLFRSKRHEIGFNDFDKHLSDLQRKFEEACPRRSVIDTPSVSAVALGLPPGSCSHALESKPSRRRFRFTGLKSRLDPVSSTCVDVASTTLKVLEKPGSSVPILNGVVSGISALLDTAKRVKQSKERAQALSQHSATLAEDVDLNQSNVQSVMFESIDSYKDRLSEVCAAMVPITEQGWMSRLFRLNRNEDTLDTSIRRLNEVQQRFMVGIVTQIRVEVSQLQKHTADSFNTLNHRLLLSVVLF